MTLNKTQLLGTGSYLPERILTNQELSQRVETSDEWIVQRTGIKQRHLIGPQDTVASMGAQAGKRALEMAGLGPDQIDLVICASCSQEQVFPSVACLIQAELGIPVGIAFDIQAACSGFMYALAVADQFIRSGAVRNALIVGSEAMSRIVDWTDRTTCILFGDGAGAFVLGAGDSQNIITTHLAADGRHKDLLYMNNLYYLDQKNQSADQLLPVKYIQQQGSPVFRHAVTRLSQLIDVLLEKSGFKSDQIDWLVPHQANIRIIQAMAKKMNLPLEKVVLTIQEHGNTSAASIPLALDTAVRRNQVSRGSTLLLEAFGGGLTWGGAIVKF